MSRSAPNSVSNDNAGEQDMRGQEFLFDCDHLVLFCDIFEKADLENQTETLLDVKFDELEGRWRKVQDGYRNVMMTPGLIADKDFKDKVRLNYNICAEEYYSTRSKIIDILRIERGQNITSRRPSLLAQYRVPGPNVPAPIPNEFSVYHGQPQDSTGSFIKVPPCDTEIFKGGYEEWPSFRDMFTAVYVNHPKLTRAQKLYHLRNKTRGSAGAIVKRYTLCDENFDLAWDALKTRYENKRVLVDNQLRILFNIPPATVENSDSIQKVQSTVNDCLSTLKTLDVDVDGWDPILIYLISTKLPDETLSLWEQSLKSHRDLPRWSQMDEFLVNRFEVVERISRSRSTKDRYSTPIESYKSKTQTFLSQDNLALCTLCNNDHSLRICPEFKKLSTQERIDYVFRNKICNNCLSTGHVKNSCKSKKRCWECKKNHHTLLHIKTVTTVTNTDKTTPTTIDGQQVALNSFVDGPSTSSNSCSQIQANFSSGNETILLRTALVQVEHDGELFTIRALIDPGSQRTFLSERIRNRLKIPYRKALFEISGIGGQHQTSSKECELTLVARRTDSRFTIRAIVLPKVTQRLPASSFEIPQSSALQELDLADPNFNKSAQVDLVLGNDSERFINIDGIKKNICGTTSAYNTVFGWVLSGPIRAETVQSFSIRVPEDETRLLHELIRKFWETEEVLSEPPPSKESEFCENFYKSTTIRREDGRYMVRLPFKQEFPQFVSLGSSRFMALAQYSRMERTLSRNPELHAQYEAVLNEYLKLGHMEEVSPCELSQNDSFRSYYLPHHAVLRPEHKTTKLRIVFNASRKTKSGFSLNDVLYTGPTLQNDLTFVILNWRKYKYVFSGDIQKMYRQILVHPADRPFQRIVHRKDSASSAKDYQLNRVTFGINCAPFLSIRTILQLATDCQEQFPQISSILRNEIYVDDVLSGGFTLTDTKTILNQLVEVLNSAGFPLRKFASNDSQLLQGLSPEDLYESDFLRFQETSSAKALGLKWNAYTDTFSYSFNPISDCESITKRKILSAIASLFDPAGWITPIIIRAKIMMQQLWLEGIGWDDDIGQESLQKWRSLVSDLSQINEITINRWIQYFPTDNVEIHGFSDASKAAYCACVYVRSQTSKHVTFSNLLVAKSKVAPLQTVCLPRLELNGALLLAKLVNFVISKFDFKVSETFLWTDSSIVLGWLSKPPWNWETYVANRTSQIHSLVPNAKWRHVPTRDNPADIGTRGSNPQELKTNSLWWTGPSWITNPSSTWPLAPPQSQKQVQSFNVNVELPDILDRFSSYPRALRVLAYIYRFYSNCCAKTNKVHTASAELTHSEIKSIKTRLIILAQKRFFQTEYGELKKSNPISNKSSLSTLNPFLDSHGIMRVNGRLADSSLSYNERYPIILPGNSRLCHLYLSHLHLFLAHGECILMCRMLQTEFYLARAKTRVKSIIRKCKTCVIFKHKPCSQIMAPLPPERCTITPPCHFTGIDFAGPFELKSSHLPKSPIMKGYAGVFVCFSTKAIHLEPCSDLSSAAFEAAFARFVGRRGLPQRVISDNGRNFIGASRHLLKEFSHFLKSSSTCISQKYSNHGFEWRFIPPHAPHMGGLWEAAVKSFKYHLKRIAGSHRFTFEQFATVLTRIEGVLNSRPISAMSEDPSDLTALTPGHFIKGAPIMALPEPVSTDLSLINRWLKLKALHHQFALRWKEDYLKALQKRYKWKNCTPNIKIGDLVVVLDDLLPPCEWRLGRVEKTHIGSDNMVRVADIRVETGTITRPIVKLCLLPFDSENISTTNVKHLTHADEILISISVSFVELSTQFAFARNSSTWMHCSPRAILQMLAPQQIPVGSVKLAIIRFYMDSTRETKIPLLLEATRRDLINNKALSNRRRSKKPQLNHGLEFKSLSPQLQLDIGGSFHSCCATTTPQYSPQFYFHSCWSAHKQQVGDSDKIQALYSWVPIAL
ncbi:uncharacterized protein LOC142235769 [Haematobia irritans]|uniref:uncharacterized protein LOC142235769 n=1 Tax=Haematobia irritans TaxID=7368 RepID=UPI003F5025C9